MCFWSERRGMQAGACVQYKGASRCYNRDAHRCCGEAVQGRLDAEAPEVAAAAVPPRKLARVRGAPQNCDQTEHLQHHCAAEQHY